MGVVGSASKLFMQLNRVKVVNRHTFLSYQNYNRQRGLVTVANHHCCLDETLIWCICPWRLFLWDQLSVRWTPGAAEIMFRSRTPYTDSFLRKGDPMRGDSAIYQGSFINTMSALGRAVPVVRGEGVYQRGMDFCIDRLEGPAPDPPGWIHTFPEGGVNTNKDKKRLKWGVGRLVSEAAPSPVVLPFWHWGMDDVLPNTFTQGKRQTYIPRIGKKVTILFGEPMDFTETLKELRVDGSSPREERKVITDKIQTQMHELADKCWQIHKDR